MVESANQREQMVLSDRSNVSPNLGSRAKPQPRGNYLYNRSPDTQLHVQYEYEYYVVILVPSSSALTCCSLGQLAISEDSILEVSLHNGMGPRGPVSRSAMGLMRAAVSNLGSSNRAFDV